MFICGYNEICFNHLQPVAGKTYCRAALGRCRRWRRIGTATRRFGCRSPGTHRYTIHRVTQPMALSCRWCSSFCCMLQRHLRSENQQKKRKRCSENPCVLFIVISRYLKHCPLSVQGLRVQSSQVESTLHTVQIRWNILNSRPKQKICERSWTSSLVPKLQFERERARSLRFMTWLAPLGGQLTHGSARAVTRFQVVLKLRKESSFDFLP